MIERGSQKLNKVKPLFLLVMAAIWLTIISSASFSASLAQLIATSETPVIGVTHTSTDYVTDTFTRDDSTSLGTTEDSNAYPWNLTVNSTYPFTASISDGALCMVGPTATTLPQGAVIGNFVSKDFDVTYKCKYSTINTAKGWATLGFAYRGYNDTDGFSGYVVRILPVYSKDSTGKYYTSVVLHHQRDNHPVFQKSGYSFDFTNWNTIHVRAIGNRHSLWINGTPIYDLIDNNTYDQTKYASEGPAMFCCSAMTGYFDDLNLVGYTSFDNTGTITGKVIGMQDSSVGVANATVTLDGITAANTTAKTASTAVTTTTDSNGNYEFDNVCPGPHTISATASEYIDHSISVNMPDSEITVDNCVIPMAKVSTGSTVVDTFTRGPSSDLGSTETTGGAIEVPWVKSSDAVVASLPYSGALELGSLSTTSTVINGAYLDAATFAPSDFDVNVPFSMSLDAPNGQYLVMAYRQPTLDYTGGGYYVYIASSGAVKLMRGSTVLATATATIDPYSYTNIRISAVGSSHKVWASGSDTPDINVTDDGVLAGGYFGFAADINNVVDIGGLNLTTYQLPTWTMSGVVKDAATSQPISNANVTVLGKTVTTDTDGSYSVTVAAADFNYYAGESASIAFNAKARGYVTAAYNATEVIAQSMSEDITLTPRVPVSIPNVKSGNDGTEVYVKDAVVTGKYNGYVYIEDKNRTSGIKVKSTTANLNDIVAIVGTIATENGEKYLTATETDQFGTAKIEPLGTSNRSFAKGSGLSSVGLLMKTWGKVTYIDPNGAFMYVDDGSVLNDGNTLGDGGAAITGIKVLLDQTYDLSLPKIGVGSAADSNGFYAEYLKSGDSVSVTGVVALSSDGSQTPVLVPRSSMDITYANDVYEVVHESDTFPATEGSWSDTYKIWTMLSVSTDNASYNWPITGGLQCIPGTSYIRVRCHTYEGVALKNLRELKYSAYMNTMPTNVASKNTFSLQLSIDTQATGDETCDDVLVYEPYTGQGTTTTGVLGTWQVWDALKNGLWWSQNLNSTNGFTRAKPVSFSTYLAYYPNATLVTSSTDADTGTVYHYWQGTFSVNVYPWYAVQSGFVGTLGSVTVGVNTPDENNNEVITNTTYSFIPDPDTQQ